MSKSINVANAVSLFRAFGDELVVEEAKARGIEVEDPQLAATLIARDTRNLQGFVATVYNLSKGKVTSKELQPMLTRSFPEHDISDRHGSHYLSKVRSGEGGGVAIRAPIPASKKARVVVSTVTRVPIDDIPEKTLAAIVKRLDGSKLGKLLEEAIAAQAQAGDKPESQGEAKPEGESKPEGEPKPPEEQTQST